MVKRFFILLILSSLVSCVSTEENKVGDSKDVIELQNKIKTLEEDIEFKDSLYNSSLAIFSDIEESLQLINYKKSEIRMLSSDSTLTQDEIKDRILQEIAEIKNLQDQNQSRLRSLNNSLSKEKSKNLQLVEKIDQLQNKIIEKEFEIGDLTSQLAASEDGYADLYDSYMAQVTMTAEMQKELNTVYYVMGSQKELKESGVIERKGGLIGIGKVSKIKDDFSKEPFTKGDLNKMGRLNIKCNKVNIVSDHHSASYTLKPNDTGYTLIIDEPREFWSLSKYLVIEIK
jgi:hypothetical protein